MPEREFAGDHLERNARLARWLEEKNWDYSDAMDYVALFDVSLRDDLQPAESDRARAFEQEYHAPDNFQIFHDFRPETGK